MAATVTSIKDSAPGHLSAEAKRLWRDVVRDYAVDDAAGQALLLRACEALDGLRECQQAIRKDGIVTSGSRNQPRPHPLLRYEAEYSRQMLAAFRALNLDLEPPK